MSAPRRVVLIGLMGAGKSTVAALVAEQIGALRRDTDELIEAEAGQTIAEIFATEGEPSFRHRELAALELALDGAGDVVVATGGGVVTMPEAAALLSTATVVYLKVSPKVAAQRVGMSDSRPLLGDAPGESLERLTRERSALYEALADVTVDADAEDASLVAAAVIADIGVQM